MYPLALIALINTTLVIHLSTTFVLYLKDLRLIRKDISPSTRLMKSLHKSAKLNSHKRIFWNGFEDSLSLYERRVFWLSNLAGISTLSGLLGTVIGIYLSFQNMKASGSASAEVFADGISVALLTTIAGLMIAIPSMISFYVLKHLLEIIEEKAYAYLFRS